MALESFDNQNLAAEVQDKLGDLDNNQAQEVKFTISREEYENSLREKAKVYMNWLKNNVWIDIPDEWNSYKAAIELLKNVDSFREKNTVDKVKLCRQVLTCMKLDENIVPKKVQNSLIRWCKIEPWQWLMSFDNKSYCCNRWQFIQYCKGARKFALSKIKWVYEQLFWRNGFDDNIDIKSLSTWDWSSTKWTAWFDNVWRLFRSYRDSVDSSDKLDTTKNYIKFWEDETKPTKISIFPSWYDSTWWKAELVLQSKTEPYTTSKIVFEYKKHGNNEEAALVATKDWVLPEWITFNNTWVSLPHSVWDNYFVALHTSSYPIKNRENLYDEVNFDVIVENWWFGWGERISSSFETWEYIISDSDKEGISQKMAEIMNDINKWNKKKIEMSVVSNTLAYNYTTELENRLKKYSGFLKINIEKQIPGNTDLVNSVINQFYASFNENTVNTKRKKKDWSIENNQKQIVLQRELALNRFLWVVLEMLKNKSFKEKFEKWEIPFEVKFRTDETDKFVAIKAKPIS